MQPLSDVNILPLLQLWTIIVFTIRLFRLLQPLDPPAVGGGRTLPKYHVVCCLKRKTTNDKGRGKIIDGLERKGSPRKRNSHNITYFITLCDSRNITKSLLQYTVYNIQNQAGYIIYQYQIIYWYLKCLFD